MLTEDTRLSKNNAGHNLCDYELGTRCVGAASSELPSMNFANGAVCTQNDDIESITALERSACSHLPSNNEVLGNETSSSSSTLTCQERRELFKRPRCDK